VGEREWGEGGGAERCIVDDAPGAVEGSRAGTRRGGVEAGRDLDAANPFPVVAVLCVKLATSTSPPRCENLCFLNLLLRRSIP
jgi:hypothetical protein